MEQMSERSITYDVLLAWALWLLGTLVLLGDAFAFLPDDSAWAGLPLLMFGHLMVVQRWIYRRADRERQMFLMGQDSVRPLK